MSRCGRPPSVGASFGGWPCAGTGPQHWNRTATHFLGLANRLGWKPLLLIAPSDHKRKSNSIEFVYQKPLKRP